MAGTRIRWTWLGIRHHQAQTSTRAAAADCEEVAVEPEVLLAEEDGLPAVAPLRDMVRQPRRDDPSLPRHGREDSGGVG